MTSLKLTPLEAFRIAANGWDDRKKRPATGDFPEVFSVILTVSGKIGDGSKERVRCYCSLCSKMDEGFKVVALSTWYQHRKRMNKEKDLESKYVDDDDTGTISSPDGSPARSPSPSKSAAALLMTPPKSAPASGASVAASAAKPADPYGEVFTKLTDAIDELRKGQKALSDKVDAVVAPSTYERKDPGSIKTAISAMPSTTVADPGPRKIDNIGEMQQAMQSSAGDVDSKYSPARVPIATQRFKTLAASAPVDEEAVTIDFNVAFLLNVRESGSFIRAVETFDFSSDRNKYECRLLAKALDLLDLELDLTKSKAAEVLMRRLGAVQYADEKQDWEVAGILTDKKPSKSLVPSSELKAAITLSKAVRAITGKQTQPRYQQQQQQQQLQQPRQQQPQQQARGQGGSQSEVVELGRASGKSWSGTRGSGTGANSK